MEGEASKFSGVCVTCAAKRDKTGDEDNGSSDVTYPISARSKRRNRRQVVESDSESECDDMST
jgi:hypothetical protein